MAKKTTRDPNAPKRNMSAFVHYQNAMRDQVKAQNPGISIGQMAKYNSQMYASLSPSEKEAWVACAEADKQRYQHELANYVPPPGYDAKGHAILPPHSVLASAGAMMTGTSKGKREKDANAPKRNVSAYLLYQNAMRDKFKQENPGMTFGQLAKYTSYMYKNLSPEEKAHWDQKAKEDKQRYEAEKAGYVPPPNYDANGNLIHDPYGGGSSKRQRKAPKDPAAPKRARTSFVLFTFDMRPQIMKEFPGIKFVEMGNIMGERWRALTPEQKKHYEDLAAQDKIRFQMEMEKYPGNPAVNAAAFQAAVAAANPGRPGQIPAQNQPSAAVMAATAAAVAATGPQQVPTGPLHGGPPHITGPQAPPAYSHEATQGQTLQHPGQSQQVQNQGGHQHPGQQPQHMTEPHMGQQHLGQGYQTQQSHPGQEPQQGPQPQPQPYPGQQALPLGQQHQHQGQQQMPHEQAPHGPPHDQSPQGPHVLPHEQHAQGPPPMPHEQHAQHGSAVMTHEQHSQIPHSLPHEQHTHTAPPLPHEQQPLGAPTMSHEHSQAATGMTQDTGAPTMPHEHTQGALPMSNDASAPPPLPHDNAQGASSMPLEHGPSGNPMPHDTQGAQSMPHELVQGAQPMSHNASQGPPPMSHEHAPAAPPPMPHEQVGGSPPNGHEQHPPGLSHEQQHSQGSQTLPHDQQGVHTLPAEDACHQGQQNESQGHVQPDASSLGAPQNSPADGTTEDGQQPPSAEQQQQQPPQQPPQQFDEQSYQHYPQHDQLGSLGAPIYS